MIYIYIYILPVYIYTVHVHISIYIYSVYMPAFNTVCSWNYTCIRQYVLYMERSLLLYVPVYWRIMAVVCVDMSWWYILHVGTGVCTQFVLLDCAHDIFSLAQLHSAILGLAQLAQLHNAMAKYPQYSNWSWKSDDLPCGDVRKREENQANAVGAKNPPGMPAMPAQTGLPLHSPYVAAVAAASTQQCQATSAPPVPVAAASTQHGKAKPPPPTVPMPAASTQQGQAQPPIPVPVAARPPKAAPERRPAKAWECPPLVPSQPIVFVYRSAETDPWAEKHMVLHIDGSVQFDASAPHGSWAKQVGNGFDDIYHINFHCRGEVEKIREHMFIRIRGTDCFQLISCDSKTATLMPWVPAGGYAWELEVCTVACTW